MTRTRTLVALLLLLGVAITHAQGNDTSPTAPEKESETFDVRTLHRDPFWPVGWEPPQLGPVKRIASAPRRTLTKWDEAKKMLRVTGLSKGSNGKYMAILKGVGVVEEGDPVSVNYMGLTYRWKIKEVTSRGIVPERTGVYPMK